MYASLATLRPLLFSLPKSFSLLGTCLYAAPRFSPAHKMVSYCSSVVPFCRSVLKYTSLCFPAITYHAVLGISPWLVGLRLPQLIVASSKPLAQMYI